MMCSVWMCANGAFLDYTKSIVKANIIKERVAWFYATTHRNGSECLLQSKELPTIENERLLLDTRDTCIYSAPNSVHFKIKVVLSWKYACIIHKWLKFLKRERYGIKIIDRECSTQWTSYNSALPIPNILSYRHKNLKCCCLLLLAKVLKLQTLLAAIPTCHGINSSSQYLVEPAVWSPKERVSFCCR